jgi:hypothetical protein
MSKIDITNLTISNISGLNTDETNQIFGGTSCRPVSFSNKFVGEFRTESGGITEIVPFDLSATDCAPPNALPPLTIPSGLIPTGKAAVNAIACAGGNCKSATFSLPSH